MHDYRLSLTGRTIRVGSWFRYGLSGLAVACVAATGIAEAFVHPDPVPTPIERSGYRRASTSAEVSEHLRALEIAYPRARVEVIGESVLGRPLEALVLTSSPGADPASVERLTVEVLGSQHGMEGAGTESLLFIARELLAGDLQYVLADVNVVLIPNANPDGFEINKRLNANGVNLNTDFVALTQPESIAIVRTLERYEPEVVLDVHESAILKRKSLALEGYLTNFIAQFEIANNPNISRQLRDLSLNEVLTPWIAGVDGAGFDAHRYFGEIRSSRQPVTNGGLSLHNFRNRAGIEGRLSFLMETRLDPRDGPYPTFHNLGARIARQRISIERFLRVVHERRDLILAAIDKDRHAGNRDALALDVRYVVDKADPPVAIELRRIRDGQLERIEFVDSRTVATRDSLRIPAGYLVRDHQSEIAKLLDRQGIHYERLEGPRTMRGVAFDVPSANVGFQSTAAASPTAAASQATMNSLDHVREQRTRIQAAPGDLWIDLKQPRGRFAALILEPRSGSSLFRTAANETLVSPGENLPIVRIP
jgi:hypothetical protein